MHISKATAANKISVDEQGWPRLVQQNQEAQQREETKTENQEGVLQAQKQIAPCLSLYEDELEINDADDFGEEASEVGLCRSAKWKEEKDESKDKEWHLILRDTAWLRRQCAENGSLAPTGEKKCTLGLVPVMFCDMQVFGLLDLGASHSISGPRLIHKLKLRVQTTSTDFSFRTATDGVFCVNRECRDLTLWFHEAKMTYTYLVAPIPFDFIFGLDMLKSVGALWDFESGKLILRQGRSMYTAQVQSLAVDDPGAASNLKDVKGDCKGGADRAFQALKDELENLNPEQKKALAKPPARKYNPHKTSHLRVKLKAIIAEKKRQQRGNSTPLSPLHKIRKLTSRHMREVSARSQCVLAYMLQSPEKKPAAELVQDIPQAEEAEEQSTWDTAVSTHERFVEWIRGKGAVRLPKGGRELLPKHRSVFPDALQGGLPTHRPYDHRIMLTSDQIPARKSMYKMSAGHMKAHQAEVNAFL